MSRSRPAPSVAAVALGAILTLAALVVGTAGAGCQARSVPLPDHPDPLSLLARPTLDGRSFDPAAVRGKVVVVNFWSPG